MNAVPFIYALVILGLATESCLAQGGQPPVIQGEFPEAKYFRGESDPQTLDCKAGGVPAPTYEWRKDGQTVVNSQNVEVIDGSLTLTAPRREDNGYYQCFASNGHGVSMTTIVHVVKGEMDGFPVVPNEQVQAEVGSHVILDCPIKPNSVPEARLDWTVSKSGTDTVQTSARVVVDQSGRLHFINVQESDMLSGGGLYRCSILNTVIQQRAYGYPKILTVTAAGSVPQRAPYINYKSSENVGLVGKNITLQCVPDGYPLPTVQWSRVNGEMPAGRYERDEAKHTLTISYLREEDEGTYRCEASNDQGTGSDTIFLDVKAEPIWEEKMKPLTVTNGMNAEFNCVARSARGETDAVSVQWYKNGVPLQPGLNNDVNVFVNRLTVADVKKPDNLMSLQCNVSNSIGYKFADAFLNVIDKTELIEKPEPTLLIDPGQLKEVRVSAVADPLYANKVDYTWRRNGQPITPSKKVYVNAANSLVINATELEKNEEFLDVLGNYSCHVTLGLGGVGDVVTYVHVTSKSEEEIIQEAALDLWWIAVVVAAVVIILIIILIICLLFRNRGGAYKVDEKERRAGNDPEKELEGGGFQDLARADAPEEKKPYDPDQVSLTNDPPIGGDTNSLDEYGEPDSSKFNEDGSFILKYGGRENQANMNQSTV